MKMNMANKTTVAVFILSGFSNGSDVQIVLFAVFLVIYLITLLGNLIIIGLVAITPNLQTPMYFFLFQLSWLDIGSVTVTMPKMLTDLLMKQKCITFMGCMSQLFAFLFLGGTEAFLLSVMCYDRYVAISYSLSYTIIMSRKFCFQLLAVSWMIGFLYSFILTFQVSQLPFCGQNVMDHFFCEIPPLLKLACADILPNEIVVFTVAGALGLTTCLMIFMSYLHIIRVILRIPSVEGRRKVFSTCSAHLTVVILMLGSGAGTHFKHSSSSVGQDKLASLFYAMFPPLLNPIIYSLRNEEVKMAARKAMRQKTGILRAEVSTCQSYSACGRSCYPCVTDC